MNLLNFFKPKGEKCPYCGATIEKELKGKFKCAECNGEIVLQKNGDKTIMITQMAYESIRIEKKKQTEENKYYKFFKKYNLSSNFLDRKKNEWVKKFGDNANLSDLIWSLSNELISEFSKKNDFFNMKMIYHDMALIQKKQGKEFFHLLQLARKMELYEIKQDNKGRDCCKVVIIATYNKYCKDCQEQDGKIFTIEEALEKMPLPVKNCTNDGFCTCCYAAI